MAKYIFIYHGGTPPQSPEEGEKVMAEWKGWFQGLGDAVADMGAPLGASSTLLSDGSMTGDGGINPASGYSLIEADTLDGATTLAAGCPILKVGGSVEVAEAMDM